MPRSSGWPSAPSPSASRSATAAPPAPSAASHADPEAARRAAARRRLPRHRAAGRGQGDGPGRAGRRRDPLRREPPQPRRRAPRDRPAAGDPPSGRAARPAAGDGRPGGRPGEADRRRPDRFGGADRRPRRRLRRRQGARTAANLRDVGVNVDLAPVLDVARPGSDTEETERGFGSSAPAVAATAIPFAAALQEGGVAATAKHFPGLGSARLNTDVAVQRVPLSKSTLRRVDEAPYRRFVAIGGEMVMISSAIYPALSPKPAAFSRSIATGELRPASASRASRSPTRSAASRSPTSAGRRRPGWRRPAPAPTCCSSPTTGPAPAPGAPCCAACGPGRLRRAGFEASAGRVLRLRHGLAGPSRLREAAVSRRGARRRGRRPWPRTSPRRPRR